MLIHLLLIVLLFLIARFVRDGQAQSVLNITTAILLAFWLRDAVGAVGA